MYPENFKKPTVFAKFRTGTTAKIADGQYVCNFGTHIKATQDYMPATTEIFYFVSFEDAANALSNWLEKGEIPKQ